MLTYDLAIKVCSNGYLITHYCEGDEDFQAYTIDVLCGDEESVLSELKRWLGTGPKEVK